MGRSATTRRLSEADFPPEQARLVAAFNDFATSTTDLSSGNLSFRNLNAEALEITVTMPDPVTVPTLAGAWTGTGVGYYKDALGRVHLSGTLTAGTYGTTPIFTLPPPFRPDTSAVDPLPFSVAQSSLFEPSGLLTISSAGAVVAPDVTSVQSGVSTYLSLNGVSFVADDTSPVAPGQPFPIALAADFGAIRSMWCLSCYDTTSAPTGAVLPGIAYQTTGSGASITGLSGLSSGRTYTFRVLAFPQ